MKSYVPTEDINCPEGTSLFIANQVYDCGTNRLTLTLKNNGQFDIGGYFIYATDSPSEELPTVDLTQYNNDVLSRLEPLGIAFGSMTEQNSLGPGDVSTEIFDLAEIGRVYIIRIVPIRWDIQNRKRVLASCKDIPITENVSCFTPCTADPIGDTCDTRECGTMRNNCYEEVTCPPGCTDPEVCNLDGECVLPAQCPDTCSSLGYECGSVCGTPCPGCGGITFPHAKTICSANHCVLGLCNPANDWGNCDGNDANGCETDLLTDSTHCGDCGIDCGTESCVGGICTSGPTIGNGICDPGETCAQEPVACQGHQATCPVGQICISGACQPINQGGIGCTNYCISLLRVPPYTTSTCTRNQGQCPGTLELGGDIYCTNPQLNRCCCIH
jgi:hypothetical protein